MDENTVLKPNPERIARILEGYPVRRVDFILEFVGSVIDRLHEGTLEDWNWPAQADTLGILDEVTQVIKAFDIPEDEFWRRYGRSG